METNGAGQLVKQAWYFNGNYPWLGMLFCAPIIGLWYWCTDQYIVQRALGAPNEAVARRGSIFAAFLKLFPVYLFIIPGLVCYALARSGRIPELASMIGPDGQSIPAMSNAAFPMLVQKVRRRHPKAKAWLVGGTGTPWSNSSPAPRKTGFSEQVSAQISRRSWERALSLHQLRLEGQRAVEGRLHFHCAEFLDGEVEVLQSSRFFVGIVIEQKLGHLEAREGKFRAKRHFGCDFNRLVVILACFVGPAQQSRRGAQMARYAGWEGIARCKHGAVSKSMQDQLCCFGVPNPNCCLQQ
jgi:hypothetical protein